MTCGAMASYSFTISSPSINQVSPDGWAATCCCFESQLFERYFGIFSAYLPNPAASLLAEAIDIQSLCRPPSAIIPCQLEINSSPVKLLTYYIESMPFMVRSLLRISMLRKPMATRSLPGSTSILVKRCQSASRCLCNSVCGFKGLGTSCSVQMAATSERQIGLSIGLQECYLSTDV